jgi:hypothetical protein
MVVWCCWCLCGCDNDELVTGGVVATLSSLPVGWCRRRNPGVYSDVMVLMLLLPAFLFRPPLDHASRVTPGSPLFSVLSYVYWYW